MKHFFSISEKHNKRRARKHIQALANFDIKKLRVIPGTSWVILLEYAGLTTDERQDDKWNVYKHKKEVESKGPPRQRFQLFCYVREGPGTHGGDNPRHLNEVIGLPTSKQIEE